MLKVLPHRWWVLLPFTLGGASSGFLLPLGAASRTYSRTGESAWPCLIRPEPGLPGRSLDRILAFVETKTVWHTKALI